MDSLEGEVTTAWKGEGCRHCRGTGYSGRKVIGELLVVRDEIRDMIYSGASISSISGTAVDHGMFTMRHRGLDEAMQGETTFEEVRRVIG
jgi:type II secretory ATPase GspE/PulE/Tfp pilus assembly ATPase PilB-like protein